MTSLKFDESQAEISCNCQINDVVNDTKNNYNLIL